MNILYNAALVCAILCFGLEKAQGSPGDIDLSFDTGADLNRAVEAIYVQKDGRILVGGAFTTIKGAVRIGIARLDSDGRLDPSFDAGKIVREPFGSITAGSISSIVEQPDGKILIGGDFSVINGMTFHGVARLHPDGSVDTSFDIGRGAEGYSDYDSTFNRSLGVVKQIVLLPDGKMMVVGNFTTFDGLTRSGVARLNSDGSADTSFTPAIAGRREVRSVAVQPDGKVLIGGIGPLPFTFLERSFLTRLNTDGSTDTTFNARFITTTVGWSLLWAVALQADGKVLVGGSGEFSTSSGASRLGVARLHSNGSLDHTFEPLNSDTDASVRSIAIQPDGKVLLGGNFFIDGSSRQSIRCLPEGTLDKSFSSGPGEKTVAALAFQADGKVLIGYLGIELEGMPRRYLARLNADGSFDGSFNDASYGIDNTVHSLAFDPGGKILVGGSFTFVGNERRSRIARLHADGTLDASFNVRVKNYWHVPSTRETEASVNTLAVQDDGKILVAGSFSEIDGVSRNSIARLNADGSLDPSFDPGSGILWWWANREMIAGSIRTMVPQADGRILIAGDFDYVNDVPREGIARINPDGSLDHSFDAGLVRSHATSSVYVTHIAVQPDGKVLIAGTWGTVGGEARHTFVRLNSDGTLDAAFAPDFGFPLVQILSIVVALDQKLLVSGLVSGNLPFLYRLTTEGIVDHTFNNLIGPDQLTGGLRIVGQPDGKLIVFGQFETIDGVTRPGIARLHNNGRVDATFNAKFAAPLPLILSALLQKDGKLLIAGDFAGINGVARAYVARLHGGEMLPPVEISRSGSQIVLSWDWTGTAGTVLESAHVLNDPGAWKLEEKSPSSAGDKQVLSVEANQAARFYRLRSN